jgi:hypothetical protein
MPQNQSKPAGSINIPALKITRLKTPLFKAKWFSTKTLSSARTYINSDPGIKKT